MNQFILSRDPKQSAAWLCNSHSVKQPLEQSQMLSSCHRLLETPQADFVYKVAHANHPCTKWVRESRENYKWAATHFFGLANQYQIRFGKMHKTFKDHGVFLWERPELIEAESLTPFAQAMPDNYKDGCAVTAYQTYYWNDKRRFAKWERGVEAPYWWQQKTEVAMN